MAVPLHITIYLPALTNKQHNAYVSILSFDNILLTSHANHSTNQKHTHKSRPHTLQVSLQSHNVRIQFAEDELQRSHMSRDEQPYRSIGNRQNPHSV